ncbi:hypothetical protein VKI21_02265 [Cyanobacterium aponinum UTEX 3222]|nr:hypothetical protein VKI21_02265 [Cyanobacterium aponinum UTEX 3222]
MLTDVLELIGVLVLTLAVDDGFIDIVALVLDDGVVDTDVDELVLVVEEG